ncbi:MAG: polysaccharide deacetylase family protein, partial [Clostridia bacterium]|nr:polysaccharide deacetylase family protein [Clostridia bacterium]
MANPTMRFPGGKAKVLTLSYDDGIFEDFRLIDIMTRQGLKGTFNINAGLMNSVKKPADSHRERLTAEQVRSLYRPSGNEVALHGYTHPHLELLSRERIAYEVL